MRLIAGAFVILSAVILWSVGAYMYTLTGIAGASESIRFFSVCGGFALLVVGLLVLVSGYRGPHRVS